MCSSKIWRLPDPAAERDCSSHEAAEHCGRLMHDVCAVYHFRSGLGGSAEEAGRGAVSSTGAAVFLLPQLCRDALQPEVRGDSYPLTGERGWRSDYE